LSAALQRFEKKSRNPAAVALLRRTAKVLDVRLEGPELSIRAAIA
jgi:hypothetical protein